MGNSYAKVKGNGIRSLSLQNPRLRLRDRDVRPATCQGLERKGIFKESLPTSGAEKEVNLAKKGDSGMANLLDESVNAVLDSKDISMTNVQKPADKRTTTDAFLHAGHGATAEGVVSPNADATPLPFLPSADFAGVVIDANLNVNNVQDNDGRAIGGVETMFGCVDADVGDQGVADFDSTFSRSDLDFGVISKTSAIDLTAGEGGGGGGREGGGGEVREQRITEAERRSGRGEGEGFLLSEGVVGKEAIRVVEAHKGQGGAWEARISQETKADDLDARMKGDGENVMKNKEMKGSDEVTLAGIVTPTELPRAGWMWPRDPPGPLSLSANLFKAFASQTAASPVEFSGKERNRPRDVEANGAANDSSVDVDAKNQTSEAMRTTDQTRVALVDEDEAASTGKAAARFICVDAKASRREKEAVFNEEESTGNEQTPLTGAFTPFSLLVQGNVNIDERFELLDQEPLVNERVNNGAAPSISFFE